MLESGMRVTLMLGTFDSAMASLWPSRQGSDSAIMTCRVNQ